MRPVGHSSLSHLHYLTKNTYSLYINLLITTVSKFACKCQLSRCCNATIYWLIANTAPIRYTNKLLRNIFITRQVLFQNHFNFGFRILYICYVITVLLLQRIFLIWKSYCESGYPFGIIYKINSNLIRYIYLQFIGS